MDITKKRLSQIMPIGKIITFPPNSNLASEYISKGKSTQVVKLVKRSKNYTQIQFMNGISLILQPNVYIRENDAVEFSFVGNNLKYAYKQVKFAPDGYPLHVKIFPPYCTKEVLCIPPHELNVYFRERYSSEDWRKAKLLERFHYRGKGFDKLVGRRTVLILEEEEHGIIGYGALSATLAAVKPRFMLLNTNFNDQMKTKLINQIVRIPRVVIHPEFRGMGLGALMAKHLISYAKEHWDINGYKPILIEVVASMTEYHKFFQSAGFIEAGSTISNEDGIRPLYGTGLWESRPNHKSYNFFNHHKPKPYLVYPLSKDMVNILKDKGLPIQTREKHRKVEHRLNAPIRFLRVCVTYRARNGLTPRANEVKDSFGVDSEQMYSPILDRFNLTIKPGEVVLFTGASGSGKSTIIKLLTESSRTIKTKMVMSGGLEGIKPSQVARLNINCDENLPLIEQVGESTKDAIAILNSVGLAEAHLYLKRCSQISEGQKYRFAIAKLCDSKKPIWIADEFASTLDPHTSAIAAKGLRKLALEKGATVILAAPHIKHFVDSLMPDKIVRLRWGGFARIYSGKLCRRWTSKGLEVWAKNTGQEELTGISISGKNESGKRDQLLITEYLKRGESTKRMVLEKSDLHSYQTLYLTSKEGVGSNLSLK